MKNTVDPWAGRMGAESALLARDGFSGPEHIIDGKEGLFAVFNHVQYKGEPATFDGEALVADLPNSPKIALPHSRLRDEEFPDRSAQSRATHRHDEDGQGTQHQGRRREGNQSRSDRARRGHSGRSAQVSAGLKGNRRSFAALLHGRRTGRWHGDTAAIQGRARARQGAHPDHGQSESGA